MTRLATVVMLIAVAVLFAHPIAAQKEPDVADLLRTATDAMAAYAPRMSGLSLEEEYTLMDVTGGKLAYTRRITSDVVFLNVSGRIVALRDAFAVDSRPLRERTARIPALLAKPSEAAWYAAHRYVEESARYFQDTVILRLNEPTLALQFILPENQPKMTYKIDGRKKVQGVDTVGLRFEETKRPDEQYILATPGKSLATGRLWVDPASGRVHRTEISTRSASEFVRVAVDYARDQALDLWRPASMTDAYEITELAGAAMQSPNRLGSGQARRSFDCRARYTNPRVTPIDMKGISLR